MLSEDKSFTSIGDALRKKKGKFKLRGWIKRKRHISDSIFMLLRDAGSELQCVVEKKNVSADSWQNAEKALVESAVIVEGSLSADKRAPNGFELKARSFDVVSFGEEFPIQRDLSEEHIMNVRHLWLRSKKLKEALKARADVTEYFRQFFKEEGYLEVQAPMFVTGAVEGGATLFETPYFGKKAYLTQSSQFYLEAFIYSMEKVFTLAPSFRAEKSRTRRHVTEFWHLEMEAAWMQLPEVLDFEERMIKYICEKLVENNEKQLKLFGRDPKDLEYVATHKFKRMKYADVLKLAQKKFPKLKYGADLGEKEEREITKDFKIPLFVTHFPAESKPFYHRPDPDNPKEILCNDLLAPEGYGEIIGGGERTWKLDVLLKRMKEENLKPEQYGWYVDLRRYGTVPHSGFGLGIERTVSWLLKLPHIKESIGFPRTMNRLYP